MALTKFALTWLLASLIALPMTGAETPSDDVQMWNPLAVFQACTQIDNDIARLQCFDAAAAGLTQANDSGEEPLAQGEAETSRDAATDEDVEAWETTGDADPTSSEPKAAAAEEIEPASSSDDAEPARRPLTDPMQIVEADETMVADCKFLGSVQGKSGWGGLAANTARKGTIRSAKKRAFKLGATHIVMHEFENSRGMTPSSIAGRAYRCD